MDAIELLTSRSSMPRLTEPAPDRESMQIIQRAALRAPDHMALTPFRCDVVEGDQLVEMGKLFEQAAHRDAGFTEQDKLRAAQLPLRAPMLIVVSTQYQEHNNVPRWEQLASAACATMAMQQACFALDYGAIWRSGPYCDSPTVKAGLNIDSANQIVGFLYVGTPAVPTPIKPEKQASIFNSPRIQLPNT